MPPTIGWSPATRLQQGPKAVKVHARPTTTTKPSNPSPTLPFISKHPLKPIQLIPLSRNSDRCWGLFSLCTTNPTKEILSMVKTKSNHTFCTWNAVGGISHKLQPTCEANPPPPAPPKPYSKSYPLLPLYLISKCLEMTRYLCVRHILFPSPSSYLTRSLPGYLP
jgi:hypothetical protein